MIAQGKKRNALRPWKARFEPPSGGEGSMAEIKAAPNEGKW